MINHFTLLDYIEWIIIVWLQLRVFIQSKIRTISISMQFLLLESLILAIVTWKYSPEVYANWYYIFSIVESLVMAMIPIELCSELLPEAKTWIKRLGPAAIGVPVFCMGVIFLPWKLDFVEFSHAALRVSQLSFILSLATLCIGLGWENKSKFVSISKSCIVWFGLLVLCIEIQFRFGWGVVRPIWPLAWIVGLGSMLHSLNKMKDDKQLIS